MNQYRCETCKFKKSVKRATYSPNLIECKKTEYELSKNDQEFISKIGCASHSDFQNQRDKVLDVVFRVIEKDSTLPNGKRCCVGSSVDLKRKMEAELRQSKDGE